MINSNSRGFNGNIPEGAIAGKYDSFNGEWTGSFYFNREEAEKAEKEILENEALSIDEVNNSGWVGSK
jgi:hypothetical protein